MEIHTARYFPACMIVTITLLTVDAAWGQAGGLALPEQGGPISGAGLGKWAIQDSNL